MVDWTSIFLTAIVTALLGIIIVVLDNSLIKPYFKFKDNLLKTKICLLFYRNILTNKFIREQTNEEFIIKIKESLDSLRKRWASLSVAYSHIYSGKFSLAKLPKYAEMQTTEKNILNLSNRMDEILVSRDSREEDTCLERDRIVSDLIKFIDKYS